MQRIARSILLMCTVAAFAGLSACTAMKRAVETEAQQEARRQRDLSETSAFYKSLTERILMRLGDGKHEEVFDVLVLSGGGDFGAFGAGFLLGWGQVQDPSMRRPKFDFVAGTSTGALLAPLAYLGTDADLQLGADMYSNPPSDLVVQNGLIPVLPFHESLALPTGLRREVAAQLSDAMLERFRKEAATGRVLACATTNLDFGTFRPFDVLEGVKLDNAAFRESMMQRLIASASIPAVFPPVEIDGSYYVDGGATENVWSIRNQTEKGTPISEWRNRYPDKPLPRIRLWYLINNQFFPKAPDVKLQWIDIASAGLSTSLRSALIKDLNLSAYAAAAENAQVPGEVEFRFVAIPDDWKPPVKGTFKPETMRSLVELGRKMGADPASWRTKIPRLDGTEQPGPAPAVAPTR